VTTSVVSLRVCLQETERQGNRWPRADADPSQIEVARSSVRARGRPTERLRLILDGRFAVVSEGYLIVIDETDR
jgi:hypothetical protein